jgi:protocatechuate 3,4-dioxygenase beta subunit
MEAAVTLSGSVVAKMFIAACVVGVLAACDGDGGSAAVGSTSAPTRSGGSTTAGQPEVAADCPAPASDSVDAASVLVAAPTNGLPSSDAGGEKLILAAAVFDPECRPLAAANVTVWHTDARGRYGPGPDTCCYYAGTVPSDQHGRFRLESIRPGQYPEPGAPPAHIHVNIEHPSGQFETEIVFDATPAEHVVPVTLQLINPQGGDRHWYGEASLILRR